MNQKFSYFSERLNEMGIVLADHQYDQFMTFYEMLVETNKFVNLTSITEFDQVVEKHFLDSLSLVKAYDMKKNPCILDLGTGGGFPGIPLKIAFPNLSFVLADSLQKRIHFIDRVIDELGLNNISAVHGRAEDLARQAEYREKFDLCVSRAVANLSTLSEYCLPFVKIGGSFVSYKSGQCNSEIEAARSSIFLLGGKVVDKVDFSIGESGRCLIIVDKLNGTSKKYPRKAGMPSKNPL